MWSETEVSSSSSQTQNFEGLKIIMILQDGYTQTTSTGDGVENSSHTASGKC